MDRVAHLKLRFPEQMPILLCGQQTGDLPNLGGGYSLEIVLDKFCFGFLFRCQNDLVHACLPWQNRIEK
jgi:hypothetical protein